MIKRTTLILSILAISTASIPALSQSSSSSESYYRGPGSNAANVFVPKYNERLRNWSDQISKAQANRWLTADEVQHFLAEHSRLSVLNKTLEAKNYPKAETDALEQQFNAFNVSLSKAMNKTASGTAPNATPAVPATPGAPGTPATPATPAVPAVKPKAKTAPVGKKRVVTKTTTKTKAKKKVVTRTTTKR